MQTLKRLLLLIVLLLVLLGLIPLVLPYENYRDDLEKSLGARLQTVVGIDAINFSYQPAPMFILEGVQLGAGEGEVEQVIIPLSWKNLLNWRTELSDVVLQKPTFKQDFAIGLPSRLKPAEAGAIKLASVRLEQMSVRLHKGVTGPWSALLKLNSDGTFADLTVQDQDGHATLNIKPFKSRFALKMEASNWVMPGDFAGVRFEQLSMQGEATEQGMVVDSIKGLIFGSPVVGEAQLDWVDGWHLQGSLQTRSMQAEPLLELFSGSTGSSGRIAANAKFSYAASHYESLFKQPQIDMQFTLTDGALHNFDMVSPLKSQSAGTLQRGGQTRFDSLIGSLSHQQGQTRLTGLHLRAGKFSAQGQLQISASRAMSGTMQAHLAAGSMQINAPLQIGGQLDAPEIRTHGAMRSATGGATTQIF